MPHYHPDFTRAHAALKVIFGYILKGYYTTTQKLIDAFQNWVNQYEKPSQAAQVHVSDILKLAGVYLHHDCF
jgi:membrane protein required for beta-lactamase induction